MDKFYRFFEKFAQPFGQESPGVPPRTGLGFVGHFAGQMKGPFTAMLVFGGLTAFVEAALFMFVGIIVDMMNASTPGEFFEKNGMALLAMAVLVAIVRSAIAVGTAVIEEQIVVPGFFTMVRWQSHKTVSRQDVSFFDDELAGRVSSKVWQSGQASGDFMVSLLQIIWFIAVFAITTLVIIASLDLRLMVPVIFWLGMVAINARYFVPRIRERGRELADAAAVVTGRMVDGYSNIRTVKLFAAEGIQDAHIQSGWKHVLGILRQFTRTISGMRILFQTLSSVMLVVIAALALWFYVHDALTAGSVAIALALCLRLNLLMGRLLGLLNGLFRNFGTIQNSAELIGRPPQIVDADNASTMPPALGHVEFDNIQFNYAGSKAVLEGLNLDIKAGQKVGIVGHSGAGKTTLMNLLLRFYDLENGSIRLDGHNIAEVTQSSLRSNFGLVSQDTSLLHRSIAENIAYGMPDSDHEQIEKAARRANAHDFILDLKDSKGRAGYDTLVGERGVKLSGGQRQRIAIARVFLRDAPVLLLDEATSALDSEVEAAIQENLEALMQNKTVIAIAHRLSTIAHLERLIVMENGKIVEDGDHTSLLKQGGVYARLWERQSGGFLTTTN